MPPVLVAPNILVVRFRSVADILLATPLLRAVRLRHPAARIAFLTDQRYVPLLSDNPRVDRVISVEPTDRIRKIALHLRGDRFSHLFDLENTFRTSRLRTLLRGRWSVLPKQRLAQAMLIHAGKSLYREPVSLAERYFALASQLDIQPDSQPPEFMVTQATDERVNKWLTQAGMAQRRPFVAFAPGASAPTKRWPAEHWVSLVKRVTKTGADVVFVGGPKDSVLAAELALAGGAKAANAAGELNLQGSAALLRRAAALVSCDSDILHLATAVGTPVVGLYGPTVRQFGYFPYNAHAAVLERDLKCRPCAPDGGSSCPLKHHQCMAAITPEDVFNAMSRLLTAAPSPDARTHSLAPPKESEEID